MPALTPVPVRNTPLAKVGFRHRCLLRVRHKADKNKRGVVYSAHEDGRTLVCWEIGSPKLEVEAGLAKLLRTPVAKLSEDDLAYVAAHRAEINAEINALKVPTEHYHRPTQMSVNNLIVDGDQGRVKTFCDLIRMSSEKTSEAATYLRGVSSGRVFKFPEGTLKESITTFYRLGLISMAKGDGERTLPIPGRSYVANRLPTASPTGSRPHPGPRRRPTRNSPPSRSPPTVR